jgi:hypothetical protein
MHGSFLSNWQKICHWEYILISSILGSSMLSATLGVANPAAANQPQTTANANYGGSLGQSLLKTMLGGSSSRPQNPNTGVAPAQGNNPAMGVLQPTGTAAQLAQGGVTFPDIQGNWARSFIEALAAGALLKGFLMARFVQMNL